MVLSSVHYEKTSEILKLRKSFFVWITDIKQPLMQRHAVGLRWANRDVAKGTSRRIDYLLARVEGYGAIDRETRWA